jgi:hypothetical protein
VTVFLTYQLPESGVDHLGNEIRLRCLEVFPIAIGSIFCLWLQSVKFFEICHYKLVHTFRVRTPFVYEESLFSEQRGLGIFLMIPPTIILAFHFSSLACTKR